MTTPTETPLTDPIRDAFEAMLAFLTILIGGPMPRAWPEIATVAAKAIGSQARTTEEADRAVAALASFRVLIQRAAEEHARCAQPQDRDLAMSLMPPRPGSADPDDDSPLTEEELRAAEREIENTKSSDSTIYELAKVRLAIAAPRALREIRRLRRIEALVGGLEQANREAHQGLAKRKAEIERLRATTDEQAHRLTAAAKHLGCEPDVIVSCAETREAEIERLTAMLREARLRLAPLPRALTPEDHEPDTLPARIDAALGGKDH